MDNDNQLEVAIAEKRRRMYDALRLFRPLSTHLPLINSRSKQCLARGGNRSGKSIIGAAMVASAARRIPLVSLAGKPLPLFSTDSRPLTIWVIGKGEDHIGQTLFRLLFKPGQIPIFRDDRGRVRACTNYAERVLGESQGLISSPLIPGILPNGDIDPNGEVAEISWVKKADNHFSSVTLKNGTVIYAFTSTGDVKMGDPVDLIWIDEDLKYPAYVAEWQARLLDRKGRLLWTAWPWASNYALRKLSTDAKLQRTRERPEVFEITLRMRDNPLLDPEEKAATIRAWGEEESKSRDEGEFADGDLIMYPNYSELVHCLFRENREPDALEKVLLENSFAPPHDWAKYLILDPGHACTAVLFVATPPPDLGDFRVVYDELYLHGCDANECARQVQAKIAGQGFQEFLIDGRLARQSAIGIGKTYYQIYQEAFEALGLASKTNGCGFTFSSDDVSAGIMQVRTWLTVRNDGTTKLRVMRAVTPNFHAEIETYRKTLVKEEVGDKPAGGQADHLMDDLRYAAQHGCEWRPPVDLTSVMVKPPVFKEFQDWWKNGGRPQQPQQLSVYCGAGAPRSAA